MTALGTSLLAFVISAGLETGMIFSIDVPLNCVCVILMVAYYDRIYTKLCCGIIRCVESCENNTVMEANLAEQVTKPAGNSDAVDHTYHDTEFQTRTNMDHDVEMMSEYHSRDNTANAV